MKRDYRKEAECKVEEVKITYFCAYKKQSLTAMVDLSNIYQDSQECDICGSHGYITIDISCECGHCHTFELKKW